MPPWPMTRLRGSLESFSVRNVIASIGFEMMMKMAFGEYLRAWSTTLLTIFALTPMRSSRLMPGLRGMPDVTTTTSEPAVGA